MQLLSTVVESFQIEGRGCVMVLKRLENVSRPVRRKEPIRLAKPDGSNIETYIDQIEIVTRLNPSIEDNVAFTLPNELTKSDVPTGTEVWLINP